MLCNWFHLLNEFNHAYYCTQVVGNILECSWEAKKAREMQHPWVDRLISINKQVCVLSSSIELVQRYSITSIDMVLLAGSEPVWRICNVCERTGI